MLEAADTLYQETVYLTKWVWGVIVLTVVMLLGALAGLLIVGVSESDWIGVIIAVAVTAGVAFVGWNYRAVEIRVTRDAFEARYGLFNRTVIPASQVVSCQPTRASFGRYLGIGVRMGRDGSWAYTTSFGPAVEVRRRSQKPFVVSTNRPQELCNAVSQTLRPRKAKRR